MLRSAGLLDCIFAAFFIELSARLAATVQNQWERVAADGLGCPSHFITADVWDLLRDDAALTCHLAKFIPRDCLVLVVGGSPCLQLTPMVDGGKAGLTGPESFNFFIFPFFLYLLQNLRPDALIHGVVENAGLARTEHHNAIVDALGIHPNQAPRIDSAYFIAAPRKRVIASTLPAISAPTPYPARRPSPFDNGWNFRGAAREPDGGDSPDVVLQRCAYMTGRSDNDTSVPPTASTYQYKLKFLLFRTLDWGAVPDELLPAKVRDLLPPGTRESFDALANLPRSASRAQEDNAIPAALWLAHFGHTIGIRTPSASDREPVYSTCSNTRLP